MKTPASGSESSFSFNGPTVKHYLILSGLWLLAGYMILLTIILLAVFALSGYYSRLWMVLAVDVNLLAASLLGILWYTRRKKPPALTSDDARVIGIRWVLASVFIFFTSFGGILFSEHHGPLLPRLFGGAVGLIVFSAMPAVLVLASEADAGRRNAGRLSV